MARTSTWKRTNSLRSAVPALAFMALSKLAMMGDVKEEVAAPEPVIVKVLTPEPIVPATAKPLVILPVRVVPVLAANATPDRREVTVRVPAPRAKPLSLTLQARVADGLAEHPDMRFPDLARMLRVSQSTVYRVKRELSSSAKAPAEMVAA